MSWSTKREARNPTHVASLLLTEVRRKVNLCLVLPVVALNEGRTNHTVPGGEIHQLGSSVFETPENAMVRENKEEIGSPPENMHKSIRIGAPVLHRTAKGKDKFIQPFVGILHEPFALPNMPQEIASVNWCEPVDWKHLIETMNEGKRQLVFAMMRRAAQEKILFPCMRRALRDFLSRNDSLELVG